MNIMSELRSDGPVFARIIAVTLGYSCLHPLLIPGATDPLSTFLRTVPAAAAVVWLVCSVLRRERLSLAGAGLTPPDTAALRMAGIAAAVGLGCACTGVVAQLSTSTVEFAGATWSNLRSAPAVLISCAALALTQEILFRGYLLIVLSRVVRGASAALIASGMYSLACSSQPGYDVLSGLAIFLWGGFLTLSTYYHASVWAPWGLNFGWLAANSTLFSTCVTNTTTGLLLFCAPDGISLASPIMRAQSVAQCAVALAGLSVYWTLIRRRARSPLVLTKTGR